jgi:FkbM family methyltransferase
MIKARIIKKLRSAIDMIELPLLFRIKFMGMSIHFAKACLEVKDILGKNPGAVLDIGAYGGMYSAAASYIFPEAKIYSFEPIKESYDNIVKWQKKFPNIIPINSAVSEKEGIIDFFGNDFPQASSYKKMLEKNKEEFPFSKNEKAGKANSVRLDKFLENKEIKTPVFMKIDVQGAELDVLKSAGEYLKKIDAIMLEISIADLYEDTPTFDDIYQYLIKNGFKFVDVPEKSLSEKDGKILQLDALFVKNYS